jgi:hypothetical protein
MRRRGKEGNAQRAASHARSRAKSWCEPSKRKRLRPKAGKESNRPGGGLIPYSEFRTGLSYGDIYQMLWSHDPNPRTWRYKTRGVILRYWCRLKREMYEQYCSQMEVPF